MQKHIFEAGIGMKVDQAVMDKVDFVYSNGNFFNNESHLFNYFKEEGIEGIEKLIPGVLAKLNAEYEARHKRK